MTLTQLHARLTKLMEQNREMGQDDLNEQPVGIWVKRRGKTGRRLTRDDFISELWYVSDQSLDVTLPDGQCRKYTTIVVEDKNKFRL